MFNFPGLRMTETTDESKMLNLDATPKVIISASGMCDAGRIRHHLKHNLWRPNCAVVFVGFQSPGTALAALGQIARGGAGVGDEVILLGVLRGVGPEAHGLQLLCKAGGHIPVAMDHEDLLRRLGLRDNKSLAAFADAIRKILEKFDF